MSDTLLDIETVTLGTSLDQLFDLGFFSVRVRNALSNCGCYDVKSILDIPDTLSRSETAMKSLRRAAVGKSPLVARSGALYGKRYNLLSKSCNAVRCPPGSFYTPKLPRTIASRRNAQHNFFRRLCIPMYFSTGILRLTDTSIPVDRDTLTSMSQDNPITITEGFVV